MLEPLESDYSGHKGRFSKSSDNGKQSNCSNSNNFRLQRHQSHSPQKAAKVRPPPPPPQLHPEPPEQERSTKTGGRQGHQSPHKTVKVQLRDKEAPGKGGSTWRRGDQGVTPSRAQKATSRSPRRQGVKVKAPGGGRTPAKTKTKPTFSPKAGLAQCKVCSRSFAEERIQVHTNICTKTRAKKRKPYDVVKVNV